MKRLIIIFTLFVTGIKFIHSQTELLEVRNFIDSSISGNFSYVSFYNDRLSANLISRINIFQKKNKIGINLKNYYTSDITKLTNSLYRDFDNYKGTLFYDLSKRFTASVNYTGMIYSDDKNIRLKASSSQNVYAGLSFTSKYLGADIFSQIQAGYKFENQLDEYNKGLNFSWEALLYNLDIDGYIFDSEIRGSLENLSPRRNTTFGSRMYIEKSYSGDLARNEFDVFFTRTRKDFYFKSDSLTEQQFDAEINIEKRTEYDVRIFDRFDYQIMKNILFYLTVHPYFKSVEKENFYIPQYTAISPGIYDTKVLQLDLTTEAALNFDFEPVNIIARILYKERDEQFLLVNKNRIPQNFVKEKEDLEATKDNHSSWLRISGTVLYTLNTKHNFELTGTASILKYDTQSKSNYDDRDEVNFIFYASHLFNNLENFQVTTSADLNLYHVVYIFAEKSSNNNWNRILRLTSRSVFEPFKWLKTVNTAGIVANYTVYDFEDMVSSVKSYSFRQFNVKDSTVIDIVSGFGLDLNGELKLYDRGELNWRAFSMRPLNYFEDRYINVRLFWKSNENLIVSAGYKYFEQRRFTYLNGVKMFDTFVSTSGPVAKLRFSMNNNSYLELSGSYDYFKSSVSASDFSGGNVYLNCQINF